ncbi:Sulfate transporter, CysZ-type [hydrothermal vent metagenome]|uniref:Sulfate transporter, CysZ-type n=1 Tax=hydrothermal vent metagenome TaxID=652676 RepID=A0A3B1A594_9ZZZZ
MTNPIKGTKYFFRGLGLLNKPGIKRFVIIPFIINIIIFATLMYVASGYFSSVLSSIENLLPEFLSWLTWILWPLFFIVSLLVFSFSFSIIANLIASPFNSYLAAAVEKKLTGTPPPNSGLSLMAEVLLSIKNELRKLIYYIAWSIPIIILSFIPIINIFTPIIWFLYGAWIMSLQYLDFPMGNYSMSFQNIRANLAEKRMLTLGFGGLTSLATMIPIVNFLVMPIAVAGATILWVEEYLPQQETYEGTKVAIDNETKD